MKAVACLLPALLLSGCSPGGGDTSAARFRVVIPDNNIREEGVECAGARPFRQIHRGTEFTVEDAEGEVVAEGELPADERRTPTRRSTGASSGSRPSA